MAPWAFVRDVFVLENSTLGFVVRILGVLLPKLLAWLIPLKFLLFKVFLLNVANDHALNFRRRLAVNLKQPRPLGLELPGDLA